MECPNVEERLSDYVERSLHADEMARVSAHLHACTNCSSLLEQVRHNLLLCKSLSRLEPDAALLERILLRTSGRPRTRTLREVVEQYVLRPMLTPRFAASVALSLLFLAFSASLLRPHLSSVAALLSPAGLSNRMERGVQAIYAEGLKAYEKKNEWQAEFSFFKNNMLHKLGFMIEQLDVPVQTDGKEKSGEPRQRQEKAPGQKSSMLALPAWIRA